MYHTTLYCPELGFLLFWARLAQDADECLKVQAWSPQAQQAASILNLWLLLSEGPATHIHLYVHAHTHEHFVRYTYVYMYIDVDVYIYIYIHIHVYIYIHII